MKQKVIIPKQPKSFGTDEVDYHISDMYVSDGQFVVKDQPLFDVETQEVILEVVSGDNGRIEDLSLKIEQTVKPGDIVGYVNTEATPSFFLIFKLLMFNRVFLAGILTGAVFTSLIYWLFLNGS